MGQSKSGRPAQPWGKVKTTKQHRKPLEGEQEHSSTRDQVGSQPELAARTAPVGTNHSRISTPPKIFRILKASTNGARAQDVSVPSYSEDALNQLSLAEIRAEINKLIDVIEANSDDSQAHLAKVQKRSLELQEKYLLDEECDREWYKKREMGKLSAAQLMTRRHTSFSPRADNNSSRELSHQ